MDAFVLALAALGVLLLGLAIGWFLRSQQAKNAASTVDSMRLGLDETTKERDEARLNLAQLETTLSERERSFEQQKIAHDEAKSQLTAQFQEVSKALLGEAQRHFLERADERFNQAGEKSDERIKNLLAPVSERLKQYEEQVERVEKERTWAYGQLNAVIAEMKTGQERVRDETAKLVNSLRNAPKARGRWGEQQLKNVLESCGLAEHVDFLMEVSLETDDGRLRPDCVIKIPGGRTLLVDAKVSFNDYQDAFSADDGVGRKNALERHYMSMKNHVNALGNKAYQTQFGDTPDYVIMFVGGEHFLSAALDHDPQFWDFAFSKKVLVATPTNLVAIARTVASVWQQEDIAANARQIAELGKEMHERLAKAGEDLKKVGRGLSTAVNAYNGFANSFEGRLMVTGRKFEQLNIETGKRELEPIDAVESLPRYGGEVEQGLIEESAKLPGKAANE